MASHKSALKQCRKDRMRRRRNRTGRAALRTSLKKVRAQVASGGGPDLEPALKSTTSGLDRAVTKGLIHRNAAARAKSRLMRQVRKTAGRA